MDWVSTTAARFVANTDYNGDGSDDNLEEFLGGSFDRNFNLWSAFLTAEYEIDSHWTAVGGFGHAMRPPTLTELYSVNSFLAVLQQGFTQVQGNPNLAPEQLWQIDVGLRSDYGRFRGNVHAFQAWIQDFITYETFGSFPGLPAPAMMVRYVNTELATLTGGEANAVYDWSCWLSSFGTLSYVQGTDQTRGGRGLPPLGPFGPQEPLPGIVPLESRVGVRLHDPTDQARWAVELSALIAADQNLVAASLFEQPTPGFTVFTLRSYWQASDSLLLFAGVENLTNVQYREHLDLRTGLGVFQPGRSFYFGSELRY